MKLVKLSALALLSFGFFACGDAEETTSDKNDKTDDTEVNEEATAEAGYRTISTNSYFDQDIPSDMVIMPELNESASLAYGYTATEGSEVKELYIIVIMETLEEIESYELDIEFDALSYSEVVVTSLTESLTSHEILNGEPKVVQKNGMDCVITEMQGMMGDVGIFYKLGVFEGEKAFYQVLTWTIDTQKGEFMAKMNHMIDSFKEKN